MAATIESHGEVTNMHFTRLSHGSEINKASVPVATDFVQVSTISAPPGNWLSLRHLCESVVMEPWGTFLLCKPQLKQTHSQHVKVPEGPQICSPGINSGVSTKGRLRRRETIKHVKCEDIVEHRGVLPWNNHLLLQEAAAATLLQTKPNRMLTCG